jgi:flagellar hook-associated protein 2
MATLSSTGVGSGLDVNGLVSQLVAAERAPQDSRLNKADAKLSSEFTAMSQLRGAMSAFQSAASALKDASSLIIRRSTSSDDTALSATTASTAAAGTYDVEVVQLAKASQLSSGAFSGGPTSVVGTGTLVLSLGSKSFNVTLDATNNTLAGIRDAINASGDNVGIRATILSANGGSRLVLTGAQTGLANAVKVTTTGGDGGLAGLVYDPPTTSALSVVTAAQDAIVNVAGFAVNSATNAVDSAIDGVTLNLKKQQPGTVLTLTVANDDSAVQSKLNSFVTSYNTLATTISRLRSYDPATKAAGPLLGDAMLLNVESQLRRILGQPIAGATAGYSSLANLGITSSTTGSLSLDSTKFQAALAADPKSVANVFGGTGGIASKLYTFLDGHLSTTGDMASRDTAIAASRKGVTTDRATLDARIQVIQARYLKQFNALDAMLTQMQSTSAYLTQQLGASTALAKSAGTTTASSG